MIPTLLDNIYIIFYFILWAVTIIVYHRRQSTVDAGSAIIATYVVYALFSIITLNDPITFLDYFDYNHLTLFPLIYLYLMLMLALAPAWKYHVNPPKTILPTGSAAIYAVAIISIICAICLIPNIIGNFQESILKLVTDTDAGKDAYEEQLENASDTGSGITNITAIFFNALTEISIFIFFYFLTMKKKNWWLIVGLCFCTIVAILLPVMAGQRGPTMYMLLTVILAYMFFKRFLSKRLVKAVRMFGIGVGIIAAIPLIAITLSRFSDKRQTTIVQYINWYIGQGNIYFDNYALDDNGIRYGDRTFNMAKRLVSSSTPKNFTERRAKYSNLYINDDLFTTFVGDFAIDFGPIVAVIIFIVFNVIVLYLTRIKKGQMELHQALLLYFTMCICMQGGMTLFSFSDTGNIKMASFLILYLYLLFYKRLMDSCPKKIVFVTKRSKTLPERQIIIRKS